jgi:hypothetical protein
MKLATFTWSWTVQVPDNFNEEDMTACDQALNEAWEGLRKQDGELTDLQDR